ncbi:serine/threonine-protein kinase [Streptomyces oceani]|uniref:serine/threonine-protein kinase n=1 Tax=Streptomyces oceani TaxID=1075402 RepID=UPI000871D1AD|nr:serine/threonine-protein kinase [Streptomyces oceani]
MSPLEEKDPRSIGSYRLLGRLGFGGMGRVYLARSAGGRTVAVKVVHPHIAVDPEFRERFRREVDAARSVGSEWTAPVLDADPDAELPWVATGYVAGPSLQAAVYEHGSLPEPSIRALGAGLGQALKHVHDLGLVHRDVKPSNVLLTPTGPVLIDFGIARAGDGTTGLTSSGVSLGSPGYMSPEQALGERVGPAADLFSTGAVLAYAATGLRPFVGGNSAVLLYQVVHEAPDVEGLEELDEAVGELIMRCLAKEPEARPSSQDLVNELAGHAGGAAALVRDGWLPGAILQQMSRQAVELLDLEPEPIPEPIPEPEPEPEPEARSERQPGREPQPGHEPDVERSTGSGPAADATFALGSKSGPARAEGPAGPVGAVGPVDGVGATGSAAEPPSGGTVPEASRTRPSPRRRGLYVTLAAVATVAVLLGGMIVVRSDGDDSVKDSGASPVSTPTRGKPVTSPKPSPSTSTKDPGNDPTRSPTQSSDSPEDDAPPPSPRPSDGEGGPAPNPAGPIAPKYIGQWEGPFLKREYQAEGSVRMTLAQGRKGERVGQGAFRFSTHECPLDWQLLSAGPEGEAVTVQAVTREAGPSAERCASYAGAYELRAPGSGNEAGELRMRRADKGETQDLARLTPGIQ